MTTREGYLPLLDGLRAVAVAAVVAYHLDMSWVPGGFLGVDLFFVISGYLITTLLLREHAAKGAIAVRAFWMRRFIRLVPALAVMTAATVAMTRVVGVPEQWASVRGDALGALAYVANWRFILTEQSYFATLLGPSPLRHTWSLAVEEQWYLVWPVVVVVLVAVSRRAAWRLLPLAAIGVGIIMSALLMAALHDPTDPTRVYFGTDTRAQQLLVGAALAWLLHVRPDWQRSHRSRWGSVLATSAFIALLVAFTVTSADEQWLYRGGFVVISVVAAVVVWGVATTERTGALRWLAWSPLIWVGTRSYAIYLWHWPIIVLVRPELDRWPLAGFHVLLTGAAAELSYRLVERPVRTSTWRSGAVVGTWAMTSVVIAVTAAMVLGAPESRQLSSAMVIEPDSAALLERASRTSTTIAVHDEPVVTTSDSTSTTDPQPAPPAPVEPRTMLVYGDSTAFVLVHDLEDRESRRWNIEAYATIGCGFSAGTPVDAGSDQPVPAPSSCAAWRSEWTHWQAVVAPDVSVVMIGAWEVLDHLVDGRMVRFPDPEWTAVVRSAVGDALDIAGEGGSFVAALSLPCMHVPPTVLEPLAARSDAERVAAFNEILAEEVASRPNAEVFDLAAVLCPDGAPRFEEDGNTLRYDGVHLTPAGAQYVMDWLEDGLDQGRFSS